MKGSEYVAVVRLTDRAGAVLAAAGETCERVPATSLDGLLRNGDIKIAAKVGGYCPPTPGGQVMNVAEAGEGEFVKPERSPRWKGKE